MATAVLVLGFVAALGLLAARTAASAHRASPSASAASAKRITGKLNKSGYTVVALGYNGKAAISRKQSFSLVVPDSKLTLQLINDHTDRYAGPVVVRGKGSRVIVGFKAGAKLGKIDVNASAGYAKTVKSLAKRWLDKNRFAQARKGVPIGNGRNFGLVRSKLLGGGTGPGQDNDHSGIPNVFDVAENGNLVFNNLAGSARTSHGVRATLAQAGSGIPYVAAQIGASIEQTVNADAASITTAEIDSNMENLAGLFMGVVPGTSNYLDCSGAVWCTAGGTGHLFAGPSVGIKQISGPPGANNWGPAFPSCCSPNASGLGDILNSVTGETGGAGGGFFALAPGASSSQIGTGSTLTEDVTDSSGAVTPYPGTVQFMFTTEPALDSWSSGSDSATVSYPVALGDPGTPANPWMIGGGSGDVVVNFTFWRPQRAAVPVPPNGVGGDACTTASPPCTWIDIGHLFYESQPMNAMGSSTGASCPQSSYSTTDPNLVPATNPSQNAASLQDQANDAPANPANTLSYSLDLTSCSGGTLSSGEEVAVNISAYDSANDEGRTQVYFKIR